MLDIMKAIYDMMGKCTYPVLKEEAPRQHVEVFFQASVWSEFIFSARLTSEVSPGFVFSIFPFLSVSQQKMDKNKDGVVTIDEFIDCCQNVSRIPPSPTLLFSCWRDFSVFHCIVSLFLLRMKTSCDQCTSLKTFFNFWLTAEALEENGVFSTAPITDLDSNCVQCAMQTFDRR